MQDLSYCVLPCVILCVLDAHWSHDRIHLPFDRFCFFNPAGCLEALSPEKPGVGVGGVSLVADNLTMQQIVLGYIVSVAFIEWPDIHVDIKTHTKSICEMIEYLCASLFWQSEWRQISAESQIQKHFNLFISEFCVCVWLWIYVAPFNP